MKQGIQSLEIGIGLLEAVVRADRPLRLMEVAEASGMSPSKARMYLISLIRTGMVEQDAATGTYQYGGRAARLGLLAFRGDGLLRAAQDFVESLAAETGDPVLLSSWEDHRSMIIFSSTTSNGLPISFRVGQTANLLETATGKTFLAYKNEEEAAAALRAHQALVPGPILLRELQDIRTRGIARSDTITLGPGVTLNGFGAIAAPIFGHRGDVRFVVTVLFRTASTPATISAMIEKVSLCSKTLSLSEPRL